MNWELFAAFLVITAVLIIVPGPIVALIGGGVWLSLARRPV